MSNRMGAIEPTVLRVVDVLESQTNESVFATCEILKGGPGVGQIFKSESCCGRWKMIGIGMAPVSILHFVPRRMMLMFSQEGPESRLRVGVELTEDRQPIRNLASSIDSVNGKYSMDYYVLDRDVRVRKRAFVLGGIPESTPSEWMQDLEVDIERFCLFVTSLDGLESILYYANFMYWRNDLIAIVRQLGERNIDARPVVIEAKDGRRDIMSYSVLRPRIPIDCFDYETSVYQPTDNENWVNCESLAIREELVPNDRHLFEVTRVCAIMVSSRLGHELENAGVSGALIIDPAKFSHRYF